MTSLDTSPPSAATASAATASAPRAGAATPSAAPPVAGAFPEGQIDPRGPQFGAVLTTGVLAVVLATAPGAFATALLAVQAVFFATGALWGVARSPYGWLFRTLVRPRLAPPKEWEDAAPPRFAQTVGLVFAVVGLVGLASGATLVGLVAVGFALAAALLNAAFGFCLGCEMYLLVRRLPGPRAA